MAIVCELAGEDGASLTLTFGKVHVVPEEGARLDCALAVITGTGRRWKTEDSAMAPVDLRNLEHFCRREVLPWFGVADIYQTGTENLRMKLADKDGRVE